MGPLFRTLAKFVLLLSAIGVFLPSYGQSQPSGQTVLHVKLKRSSVRALTAPSNGKQFGIRAIDAVAEANQVESVRRIFPPAGKFEAAHQAYGLDLWYEVRFAKQRSAGRVASEFRRLSDFEKVEEPQPYSRIGGDFESPPSTLPNGTSDPLFQFQWNLDNTGQNYGKIGADIDLLSAWRIEAGKPSVIVAVIDGGIDVGHTELSRAMWVNAGEIPANGRDDDNNGYIDDYNGYGFGDRTRFIYPDPHGTHVAGVIGAVSNNSIGIAGIAGGSGTGDGVKLMSLATFGNFQNGGFEEAMVYAADNGAVISQNSWGGGSTAIEAAIEYFINRAGFDNTDQNFTRNIQTGPLAGGIVIFAAGNQNSAVAYPATYPPVMAVAASDQFDRKAGFSNYGPEIDITAPGTDILSTLPPAYGDYGAASGTSMACPHVSGVAALVVSKYGGPGVTPELVRIRIQSSADPIELNNPIYSTRLGAGRLNAAAALELPDLVPPAAISDLAVELVRYDTLVLRWTATGSSNFEGRSYGFDLRVSSSPINESNFSQATRISDLPKPPSSGTVVRFSLPQVTSGQNLYFAIKSFDRFNNLSTLSNLLAVRIPNPPVLVIDSSPLTRNIGAGDTAVSRIRVENAGEGPLVVQAYALSYSGSGTGLRSIDPSIKGRLFAIDASATRIDELNTQTGMVLRSIPLPEPGGGYNGLAFDGTHLYFAHGPKRKIYKLDATDGRVLASRTLAALAGIDGLGFSAGFLYVHHHSTLQTLEMDFETGATYRTLSMPYSSHYGGLSFGGSRGTWFVSDGSVVSEVNASLQEVNRISVWGGVTGVGYSDAEGILYIISNGVIHGIRMSDQQEVRTFYINSSALAADENQYDWLKFGPALQIPSGGSSYLPVTFDSRGLAAGNYQASLTLLSNDPARRKLPIPATMTVLSSPSLLPSHQQMNYDTTYVGFPVDSTVVIRNAGVAALNVTSVVTTGAGFSATPTSFSVAPGSSQLVQVRFSPSVLGAASGTLRLTSNDPDDPVVTVGLTARVNPAPGLDVTPNEWTVNLDAGDTTRISLQVSNTGGSVLHWNSRVRLSTVPGNPGGRQTLFEAPKQMATGEFTLKAPSPTSLSALTVDPQTGKVYGKSATTGSLYRYTPETNNWETLPSAPVAGGQAAFFVDNKVYVWWPGTFYVFDISSNTWSRVDPGSTTTAVTSDSRYFYFAGSNMFGRYDPRADTTIRLRSLPFSLQSDGGTLAYANGVIYAKQGNAFTGNGNTAFARYFLAADEWEYAPEMPGRASLGNAFDTGSRQYYAVSGSELKIFDVITETWATKTVPLFTPSDAITFVGNDGISGIYFSQQQGTQFGRLETPGSPPWLMLNNTQGSLAAPSSTTLDVSVSARGLFAGQYSGFVDIESARPPMTRTVPVVLNVTGAPDIDVNTLSGNVGPVYIGKGRGLQIQIRNKGTAPMEVTEVTSTSPEIVFSPGPFTIYPGQLKYAYATLVPVSPGPKSGTIRLITNDPNEGIVEIQLSGEGVTPPDIIVAGDTLRATVISGATASFPVWVSNGGGSELGLHVSGWKLWARATPDFAIIPVGDQKEIVISLSAGSFPAGIHKTQVEFSHYLDFPKYVQVEMTILPAPNITLPTDPLDFGNRYTGLTYDTTLVISNTGILPLEVHSIQSSLTTFQILDPVPISIVPGSSKTISIRFAPDAPGTQTDTLHILSNDPDEPLRTVALRGTSGWPPILRTDQTSIDTVALYQSDVNYRLTIHNSGLSELRWTAQANIAPPSAPGWGVADRASSPGSMSFLVYYNNSLYAQQRGSTNLYRIWVGAGAWELISSNAPFSSESAGAAVINDKLYVSYLDADTTIGVYSFMTNSWSSLPNGLGSGTANLATDGTLLYVAGGGHFRVYHPEEETWTELPLPEFVLSGRGGLSFLEGNIYVHEGRGFTRFARFNVAAARWENLAPLPEGAVIGSTIDPVRKRYYTYGSHGGRNIYEYDIATNQWNAWTTRFPLDDGGLAYAPQTYNRGVYFIQGKPGNRFALFDANDFLTWIRLSPLSGIIPAGGSQTIGLNLDARGKAVGTYQGFLQLTTNDPLAAETITPVTMRVEYRGPRLSIAYQIVEAYTVKPAIQKDTLVMENTGQQTLHWSFADDFPAWLRASSMADSIPAASSSEVVFTFDPASLPGSASARSHQVNIRTNDQMVPNTTAAAVLHIRANTAPMVINNFRDLRMNLTDAALPVSLLNKFSDAEQDRISLVAISRDTTVARVLRISPDTITVEPRKAGFTAVRVIATDEYNASQETSFTVAVVDPVSAVEPESHSILAYPNPFRTQTVIRFTMNEPGEVAVVLQDVMGRTVSTTRVHVASGESTIEINGEKLAPGLYIMKLEKEKQVVGSLRLVRIQE
ncbi:MAG: choice-of-anchor D domain-containing protein [Cyclobacteriaceae bacterium]|nr:choice-of-anchor D domain-containing protein [Cyclobacteriaceae bacterium]